MAPGVVAINNVIAGNRSGGILVSGDTNGGVTAPQPFARVINNTIYGVRSGDNGIRVENNAAPTLVNNAIANTTRGIQGVNPGALEIFEPIYADNGTNATGTGVGLGAFPLTPVLPDLFVDPAGRNFYPLDGSPVIDSSVSSVDDRTAIENLRLDLGISSSPILAPERDLTGQQRVDGGGGGGTGSSVFIDRGALDRSDSFGPIANLSDPLDNGADGRDVDVFETYVRLTHGSQSQFVIQLSDVDGTGLDDTTVTQETLVIHRKRRRLIPGTDYTFAYTIASNTITLTPASGVWNPNAAYEMTLNNRDRIVIGVTDGLGVLDGEQFVIEDVGRKHRDV